MDAEESHSRTGQKSSNAAWKRSSALRRYLDEQEGIPIGDIIWTGHQAYACKVGSEERLGYPTQKPQALLERIIAASSNPGDLVLDPFCGCGTTVHAAQALGRRWIGIDVTHLAIGLIEKRLRDAWRDRPQDLSFKTYGVPQDIAGARDLALRGRAEGRHRFEFEKWAVSLLAGQQTRNTGDGGIDGLIPFGRKSMAVVSVKSGANVGVGMIRDLRGAMERMGAEIGVFLTFTPPNKGMIAEAASAGQHEEPGFAPRAAPPDRDGGGGDGAQGALHPPPRPGGRRAQGRAQAAGRGRAAPPALGAAARAARIRPPRAGSSSPRR